jgi:molybdopterin converting factor small subunit
MQITVKLFATLRRFNEKEFKYDISEGTTIESVIGLLEIPHDEVAIIMVNGIKKTPEVQLYEEDVLALFPAVGGG